MNIIIQTESKPAQRIINSINNQMNFLNMRRNERQQQNYK